MGNSFIMRTEANYSLNFLVYIQNIYLNQTQSRDEIKFPYLPATYIFQEDFEIQFRKLWIEVSNRISHHPIHDLEIFTEEKMLFYQRLFAESETSMGDYEDIYQSFTAWWDSFAGRFAIERSIDIDDKGQKIYMELAKLLTQKGIEPQNDLNISLLYDDCIVANMKPSSNFAVIPIRDFFINYKKLIPQILDCIY
jgi:L-rhamnose mutarotase